MADKSYKKGETHSVGPGGAPRGGFAKPKNMKKSFARLFGYLLGNKLKLVLVFLLLIVSTGTLLAGSYMLKPLIDRYIIPGDFSGLALALLGLGAVYVGGAIASYIQSRMMVTIAHKTVRIIRRDLFDKMQALPIKFFDNHTHGELMSRYTNDVDNITMMLEQSITQLISSVVIFIGVIVFMLVLSPLLFLFVLLGLIVMVFASVQIGKRSRKHFAAQQKDIGEVNGYIEEMIEGLKVVKVFNHEKECKREFQTLTENLRKSSFNAMFYAGVIMPLMNNLNNIVYAITAIGGGVLALTTGGAFTVGSLGAFLQFSRNLGQPINQISSQINNLLAALAGAERIFEIMDMEPESDEGSVTLVPVRKENGKLIPLGSDEHPTQWAWKQPGENGNTLIELRGDVRFKDVSFSYDGEKTVLRDVSLYAKPGQKIAFVGSTGAGKTTITNLINRFYDVQEGEITYDGIKINDIKKDDLRHSLAIVLQDTHLFTGTVYDNIRYGKLDATDEECVQAAKRASAHSFIRRLPDGYHTMITGDGDNLSQGQRQLLNITRALVADPPVLILDEATSSIDTRTERLIEKGMNVLMEGRTVFVIAHRLSTVRNSNAIIVLEHGEIIERGDHESLLEQKGRYYNLYTGQHKLE